VELFADETRSRLPFSAGDKIRLIVGLVLVVGGGVIASVGKATIRGIETDLADAFARLPNAFESAILSLTQFVTSFIPLVAIVVLLVRRRWKVALLLVLTAVVAYVAMAFADAAFLGGELRELRQRLVEADAAAGPDFPDSGVIASTTAVVTVAAPWLSRGWKRAAWFGVVALVLLRMIAVAEPAFDVVLALGVGTVVGSLVLLLFGSPSHRPSPHEVLDGLRGTGFDPRRIDRDRPAGAAEQYRFVDADRATYRVSLRTPDERDADLLERTYRGLRLRTSEVEARYSTLKRRIEHEALVLAIAGRAGLHAPEVVRIGTTEGGSAFVVTTELSTRPATEADLHAPGFLDALWAEVDRLHRAGIAHGHLALESIGVDDRGRPVIGQFDDARTAPSDRDLARDVAQLLTETGVVVGPEEAVSASVAALGRDRVSISLRMLQPLALPTSTRGRATGELLDGLREQVRSIAGGKDERLADLERIKPRTVVILAATALAFYSLLPQVADLDETLDAFGGARPGWIAAALAASAATYVFAAIAFQGALAAPVPVVANLRAQLATSFAGLVGPAGTGGFAVTARFLQRSGVKAGEAGASVAVKTLTGFAVHAALLVGFVVWAGRSGLGDFEMPAGSTILLGIAIVLAAVGLFLAIRPVRRRLLTPLLASLRDGAAQIGRVFRRPSRVAALFGGSLGVSLTYVAAVACSVLAFGGDLTLAQVGAAYLVAVALATFAPTPGGLGALESAMIAGFRGFGLDAGIAISATLMFRLATFWLPIIPGWLSMRYMQSHDEL
jgi:glycosyltransferase 2 family protein